MTGAAAREAAETAESLLEGLWYHAMPARALRRGRMRGLTLLGRPLLLGRAADGKAFALRDICPHRGIPLSDGQFDGQEVECAYHGWRFRPDGQCSAIPSLVAGQSDMRDKVDPYLRPLYDALYDVLPPEKVEREIESGTIEIAPLAFMRGRTLANAFVILDEAQNATTMQMKMFLTRLGEDAKMVVTGDPSQIDLPAGQKSGLIEAVELLQSVDGIQAVRFQGDRRRSTRPGRPDCRGL